MGLIIADEKLQKAIARFFEKLEEYYPEHKVFALDSIDKHLQEDLSSLYKQSGCVSADEFLATHGFQRISGEEVKAIRSCVLYTPGNEPAAIKDKVDNMVRQLDEYYPYRKIPWELSEEHPRLARTISGLYQWLGYPNSNAMLVEYGFDVPFLYSRSGRPRKNLQETEEMISKLQEKYKDNKVKSVSLLISENPEYASSIKTLQNKANAVYGMSLGKYFQEIGIIEKSVAAQKPKKYHYFTAFVDGIESPVVCVTRKREVKKGDYVEMSIPHGNKKVVGHVQETYFFTPEEDLPCAVEEMYQYIQKTETYHVLSTSVKGIDASVLCIISKQDVREVRKGNYIEMHSPQGNEKIVGQVENRYYAFREDLSSPPEEMFQYARKLSKEEVQILEDSKLKYLFCSVRFEGRSGTLYYLSPFKGVEVGDIVRVHHAWYGETLATVTKVELCSEITAPYPPRKTKKIKAIEKSAKQEKEKLLSEVFSLVQKHKTHPFVPRISDPAIDSKIATTTHFSSAVFRGMDADVSAALQILYPSELNPFAKRDVLREGISQFECCSEHVPKILKDYPNLKAIFFAEDWKNATVYLGFSDSGYSTVSALRLIGNCDFYMRDRWSIIHDPTEDHFSFYTGEYDSTEKDYDFIEKDKWEALDYVLPGGKEQLASQDIIPSRPYKKLTSCDPCEIIKIEYPINEVFYQKPPEAEKKELPQPPLGTSSLAGKIFVVTGDLYNYSSREELKKIIEAMGGKLTGSVSSKTTALITNEPYSGTTKIRKAHECGIEIISEDEFIKRYMVNPSDKEHSLNEAEEIIVDDDGLIYLDDDEEYEGYPRMEDRIAAYYLYSDDPEKGGRLLEVAYTNAVLEELFEKYNYRKSEKLEGDYTNEFTLYDIIPRPKYAGVQTLEEFTTTLLNVLAVFGEANSGFEEELASRKDEIAKAFTAIEGTSLESLLDEDDFVVDGYAFELKNDIYKARYRQCIGGW